MDSVKIKCNTCGSKQRFSADKSKHYNAKYGKKLTYYTCDNCGERINSLQLAGRKAANSRKRNR